MGTCGASEGEIDGDGEDTASGQQLSDISGTDAEAVEPLGEEDRLGEVGGCRLAPMGAVTTGVGANAGAGVVVGVGCSWICMGTAGPGVATAIAANAGGGVVVDNAGDGCRCASTLRVVLAAVAGAVEMDVVVEVAVVLARRAVQTDSTHSCRK